MQGRPDKLVQRIVSQCWAPALLRYILMPFGCHSICTCTISIQNAAGLHVLDMLAVKLGMLLACSYKAFALAHCLPKQDLTQELVKHT